MTPGYGVQGIPAPWPDSNPRFPHCCDLLLRPGQVLRPTG